MISLSTDVESARRVAKNRERLALGLPLVGAIAAASTAPWTPANITSVGKYFWLRADLGVTIATGVSLWADQYGLNNATRAASSGQPAHNASDPLFNNQASIQCDGIDDAMIFSTLDLPSPSTNPVWFWLVFRMHTWAASAAIFGGTAGGAMLVRQDTTAPRITMNAIATANANNGAPPGATVRGIFSFTNSTADRSRLGASNVTGQNAGNIDTPAGSFSIAARSTGTSNFANMSIAEIACLKGEPSPAELSQLEAYGAARYPSAAF